MPENQRRKAESVTWDTPPLAADRLEHLKELFPEALTEGKVDFDKLKAVLGEAADDRPERYTFSWAGKRDAIRLLQTPSRATLKPCPEESIDWDTTRNVFIEGENLEVLKLLYKSYFGRVKLIYIDPPYNTGNDFIYPDHFADPLDTYLKLTGQKTAEGNLLTTNPETSGRYHSAWLSMMYPRLFLARQLLRDDGVIFVSIDDHEVHNLRLLMDEIFGGENFVAQLVWQSKKGGGGAVSQIVGDHEYILLYARESHPEALGKQSLDSPPLDMEDQKGPYRKGRELNKWGAGSARSDRPTMFFPIPGPNGQDVYPIRNDGSEGRWRWGKKNMLAIVQNRDALFEPRPDGTYIVYQKIREAGPSLRAYRSLLLDVGTVADGTAELKELFGGKSPFDFPKPSSLIRHLLDIGALEEDDIVLDFFAGSGTTAQAALESNHEDGASRQFIMVQLPEPTSRGDYTSIANVAKERVRGVIRKLRTVEQGSLIPHDPDDRVDIGFRVFRMDASTSRPWVAPAEGETPTAQEYADQMALFTDPLVPGWKAEDVIWEVAVKEGYGLAARIEVDRRVNGVTVYRVADTEKGQSFRICLDDKLTLGVVKKLDLAKDELFVCRDVALDDETAANLALQCRLKTI